ncbi:MAG: hypothetical protein CM15mP49_25910 [Actinomycetota bacterium]|nr:MAG: hypothetical protein CM15mP49_25910 [Actinomycetota bacterium]
MLTVATIGLAQVLVMFALLMPEWWGSGITSQRIDSPLNISFDFAKFRFNDNHLIVLFAVPSNPSCSGLLLAANQDRCRYPRSCRRL